jgi:hypothetical protein
MEVPRLEKITLNMGVGEAKTDAKQLDSALEELTIIAGQRAQVRRARKSIAQFKIREGMPIGAKVTLRGARMYEFLDRLIAIALPRIRDFRGLSPRSFDGRGNYSLGIREQIIFPRSTTTTSSRSAASTSRSRPPRDGRAGLALCAGSACRSRRTEGSSSNAWLRHHFGSSSSGRRSTACATTRAATAAGARAPSSASSASAGSACASWRTRA